MQLAFWGRYGYAEGPIGWLCRSTTGRGPRPQRAHTRWTKTDIDWIKDMPNDKNETKKLDLQETAREVYDAVIKARDDTMELAEEEHGALVASLAPGDVYPKYDGVIKTDAYKNKARNGVYVDAMKKVDALLDAARKAVDAAMTEAPDPEAAAFVSVFTQRERASEEEIRLALERYGGNWQMRALLDDFAKRMHREHKAGAVELPEHPADGAKERIAQMRIEADNITRYFTSQGYRSKAFGTMKGEDPLKRIMDEVEHRKEAAWTAIGAAASGVTPTMGRSWFMGLLRYSRGI